MASGNLRSGEHPISAALEFLGGLGRTSGEKIKAFAEEKDLFDIPGTDFRSTDLVVDFLIPQSGLDVGLAALPLGFVTKASKVPISKLSRLAAREGVPGGERVEALGKTLGDRLKPVGTSGALFEDVATGERLILDDLRKLFDEDTLQRADVVPFTPKPLDAPSRAPIDPTPRSRPQVMGEREAARRLGDSQREMLRQSNDPEARVLLRRIFGEEADVDNLEFQHRSGPILDDARQAHRRSRRTASPEVEEQPSRVQRALETFEPTAVERRTLRRELDRLSAEDRAHGGTGRRASETPTIGNQTTQQLEARLAQLTDLNTDEAQDLILELERRGVTRHPDELVSEVIDQMEAAGEALPQDPESFFIPRRRRR